MAEDHQQLIEHRRTWIGFTKLMTWSCVAIAILLLGMFAFLT